MVVPRPANPAWEKRGGRWIDALWMRFEREIRYLLSLWWGARLRIGVCVCVCVCVWERERERVSEKVWVSDWTNLHWLPWERPVCFFLMLRLDPCASERIHLWFWGQFTLPLGLVCVYASSHEWVNSVLVKYHADFRNHHSNSLKATSFSILVKQMGDFFSDFVWNILDCDCFAPQTWPISRQVSFNQARVRHGIFANGLFFIPT